MGIHFEPQNLKSRWLGYFDLLGTSVLIRSQKIYEVFDAYKIALEKLEGWKKRHSNIKHSWFSDTFLIYSEDDSAESFAAIEMVCRWFIFSLIRQKIPVRGAMSCGTFYVDSENQIFLGEALLEAYEFGENQDWIGYMLTPSSLNRLNEVNLPVEERLNYVRYSIPFKKPVSDQNYAACILGNWAILGDGSNPLSKPLSEMEARESDDRVKSKYGRTLRFVDKHKRSGREAANDGF